jgi:threonine dehydrogenase-like Zn-dependent dehydrogenase
MNHAGLASSEPGGLSEFSFVPEAQLLECKNLSPELAVFTEPLSCVIRAWKKISDCEKQRIGIIGLGPIGCIHFLYGKIVSPESEFYLFEENQNRVEMFNRAFKDYEYFMNENVSDLDFTIMANSLSTGYEKSKITLKKDGALLLFSGFNEVTYNTKGFFPEFIHREEFNFYDDEIFLFGSSGYQREDLEDSVFTLKQNPQFIKIVTGKVYGIDSVKLNSVYTQDQYFKNPVLIEDISANLSGHIKIQYHLNKSEQ